MLHALNLQMQGEIELADSMYRSILDKYPDDAAAWMQLAELEFHYNQIRGHSFADSRPAFENVYALTADPSALLHLARLASWENRSVRAESLLVRYYTAHGDDTVHRRDRCAARELHRTELRPPRAGSRGRLCRRPLLPERCGMPSWIAFPVSDAE